MSAQLNRHRVTLSLRQKVISAAMITALNPKSIGTCYEALARRYLERRGLVFVAANVILRCGEIDLIMRDKETVVFVEVRFRRNTRFGGASASITYIKKQRLMQAAAVWLAQQGASFDTASCRFDVFAITGDTSEWLTNAFSLH